MATHGIGELPDDVVAQLRSLHEDQVDLTGWFRSEDVADITGWGVGRVRAMLRKRMRAGEIEVRRVGISDQQANAIGLLRGSGVTMYRFVETTA